MKIARIRYLETEYYGIVDDNIIEPITNLKRNDLGIENFEDLNLTDFQTDKNKIIQINDEGIEWLPPIAKPGKIICVGRNYLKHSLEQGKTSEEKPILFSKYSSNMTGHISKIPVPTHGEYFDYEVELAVVIGKSTENYNEQSSVNDYILGYTIANDLTVRDVQKSEKQWTRGKAFNNSLPIGPWIITTDEVENYKNRDIWLNLNGESRQLNSTSNMIFDLHYLLKHISAAITLYPGDIILTGTPEGVGYYMEPKQTLKSGDFVSCGVSGIGELRFTIE